MIAVLCTTARLSDRGPRWVIRYTFAVCAQCRLVSQLRKYHCIAVTDETGQHTGQLESISQALVKYSLGGPGPEISNSVDHFSLREVLRTVRSTLEGVHITS